MKRFAVITGGSHGIGLATVKYFQSQEYKIINLSRSDCLYEGVSNIYVDLSKPDSLFEIAGTLKNSVRNAEQITLIHNASMHVNDSVMNVNVDDLKNSLSVNLISPAVLNTILIPLMPEGSSILYVGSTLSEKAISGACSYIVSKHALVGLMRSTTQDLKGKQIHSACVCPGFTDTKMLREHLGAEFQETMRNLVADKVVLGRILEPIEISKILYHCAQTPAINGSVIHANLGQVET